MEGTQCGSTRNRRGDCPRGQVWSRWLEHDCARTRTRPPPLPGLPSLLSDYLSSRSFVSFVNDAGTLGRAVYKHKERDGFTLQLGSQRHAHTRFRGAGRQDRWTQEHRHLWEMSIPSPEPTSRPWCRVRVDGPVTIQVVNTY